MNFQERKNSILKLLSEKGSIHIKELMENFGASEITVRRDLASMAAKGMLFRTHGGAMRLELAKDPEPVSFKAKIAHNLDKKIAICETASRFIKDGDLIFMDCGSTIFQMCQFLKTKKIKVITNSLPVLYELLGTKVLISLIGGEVDHERQAIHGQTAIDQIGKYKAKSAFISVDGISLESGLTSKNEIECETVKAIIKNSKEVFLLVDSSKLEVDSYINIGEITLVHSIITDKAANDTILKKYHNAGIKIYK